MRSCLGHGRLGHGLFRHRLRRRPGIAEIDAEIGAELRDLGLAA